MVLQIAEGAHGLTAGVSVNSLPKPRFAPVRVPADLLSTFGFPRNRSQSPPLALREPIGRGLAGKPGERSRGQLLQPLR